MRETLCILGLEVALSDACMFVDLGVPRFVLEFSAVAVCGVLFYFFGLFVGVFSVKFSARGYGCGDDVSREGMDHVEG